MKIPRSIKSNITERLAESNKIIILYGPRQVGKTTLAQDIISDLPGRLLEISADEPKYIDALSSRDSMIL